MIAVMVSSAWIGSAVKLAGLAFFLAILIPGLSTMFFFVRKLGRWPCPQCGKPFHAENFNYKFPNRECAYCHFPMWHPYRP